MLGPVPGAPFRTLGRAVDERDVDGLTSALEMVKLTPGKDFDVVILSIDPSDTPEQAAKSKALYVKRYGRPETSAGWHFLTGQRPAIDAVTNAVGIVVSESSVVSMSGEDCGRLRSCLISA